MFKWFKEKLGIDKENTENLKNDADIEKNIQKEENVEESSPIEANEIEQTEVEQTEAEQTEAEISDVIPTEHIESTEVSENISEKNIVEDREHIEDAKDTANIETQESIQEDKEDTNLNETNIEEENTIEPEPEKKLSIFQRLKNGLSKTRNEMGIKINTILGQYVKIDDDMMEDLEDILISADIGMDTTMKLIDNLKDTIINEKVNDPSVVKDLLKKEVKKLMDTGLDNKVCTKSPTIILVIGVNGVGKTTTIGKLSSKLRSEGNKVLIAAADTFRAAAIEQLKTWGSRSNVDVISHSEGADPAAVIYDAISAAKSRNVDILICDTAGRLHNKANLMKELEKINRVIEREYPQANRETLLVLDATTGQNAMNQAKTFNETSEITGIVLTKLDGTAKGGVVIALQSELEVPIKLIGVGEKIEDLQEFNSESFVDAIFD